MIRYILFIFLWFHLLNGFAQTPEIDSLRSVIDKMPDDSLKVNAIIQLSGMFYRTSPADAISYGEMASNLAESINFPEGKAYAEKSIGMGYYFQGNYIDALVSWQQSLKTFESIDDKLGVANMLNNLGAVHFNEGDDPKAIEYYLQSLQVSEDIGDKLRIATALVNIGAVYFNKKVTHDMALQYYLQSLPISQELGNYDAIGTAAVNMGEIYLERSDLDSAKLYFEKALDAYNQSVTGNVPYALNSLGKVYARRGEFEEAIRYQKEAYDLAESRGARLEMTQASLGLANTYQLKEDHVSAIETLQQALLLAEEINIPYQLKDAYEGLAASYAANSDFGNAFIYQNLLTTIKDTLYNAAMDKRIQSLTLNFDLEKKQGEIDLLTKDKALQELDLRRQKTIRNFAGIVGILMLLLAGGFFHRYNYTRKTNRIIASEKERSDKLLLNILPHETAEELKEKGSATPKHYEMVSVLFTDFKGFTGIAEKLSPQELVEELNKCFLEFDHIIDKNNLEKIKTIGDAYMCAGGIPVENSTNPIDVVRAGLEIKKFMDDLRKEKEARGEDCWEIRIGIHTGPVIAGVVGKNKFAYDIWGDAVNTASRMESSGIPGKVNISGATYNLVKDFFNCDHRGKIQAKNKGEIDMYLVESVEESVKEESMVTL
jgi:class 3 adenylate cyclase/tetratricopeptide (TPR) repeat protein